MDLHTLLPMPTPLGGCGWWAELLSGLCVLCWCEAVMCVCVRVMCVIVLYNNEMCALSYTVLRGNTVSKSLVARSLGLSQSMQMQVSCH